MQIFTVFRQLLEIFVQLDMFLAQRFKGITEFGHFVLLNFEIALQTLFLTSFLVQLSTQHQILSKDLLDLFFSFLITSFNINCLALLMGQLLFQSLTIINSLSQLVIDLLNFLRQVFDFGNIFLNSLFIVFIFLSQLLTIIFEVVFRRGQFVNLLCHTIQTITQFGNVIVGFVELLFQISFGIGKFFLFLTDFGMVTGDLFKV